MPTFGPLLLLSCWQQFLEQAAPSVLMAVKIEVEPPWGPENDKDSISLTGSGSCGVQEVFTSLEGIGQFLCLSHKGDAGPLPGPLEGITIRTRR